MLDEEKGNAALYHAEQTTEDNLVDANLQDKKIRDTTGITTHIIAVLDAEKIERDKMDALVLREASLVAEYNAIQKEKANLDKVWRESRNKLIDPVEVFCDYSIQKMVAMGFKTFQRGVSAPHDVPFAPTGLNVKVGIFPGSANLKCKGQHFDTWHEYVVCDATKDPNVTENWTVISGGKSTRGKAYDMERGKKVFIKVRAANSKGFGPYSQYVEFIPQ